jgi:pimeloyl-ACP methyl ester carboxylesterase
VATITHRFVETNGLRMHIAEAGQGPLVLLLHGFPECWYSWRHQLHALAEAGYHAVAPDQRGYGQTGGPTEIDRYTQLHLVGDIVGLLDALGAETAVVAGHDWGAPVAWHCALMRPDRFRAVIGLSVPYTPRGPVEPLSAMRAMAGDNFFYILYFQEPGVAEAELERDVRATIRRLLYSASGDPPPEHRWRAALPRTAKFLDATTDPETLPAWLTEEDIDVYAHAFARTGFRGPLNWYRNFTRTWELMAPFHGAKVRVPALFIVGERDGVRSFTQAAIDALPQTVPLLRRTIVLPGCGHWTQQERPAEVTAAMLDFLRELDGGALA